jgi:hypothetical protein
VKVWDAATGRELRTLEGAETELRNVCFGPDGNRIFAWEFKENVVAWGNVLSWPVEGGPPTVVKEHPPQAPQRKVLSPDGSVQAEIGVGSSVEVTHLRRADPKANHWPLPDDAERDRYHREQARTAERERRWFAAVFHIDRLLLDQPSDAELKRRRDAALEKHAETLKKEVRAE